MRLADAKNLKTLGQLRAWGAKVATWELWLLLLLMVTVFGIAARGPITDLPSLFTGFEPERIEQQEQDPYGVSQEPSDSSGEVRSNVETGF